MSRTSGEQVRSPRALGIFRSISTARGKAGRRAPPPGRFFDARSLVAGYQRDVNILPGGSVWAWAGRIACVLGPNGTGWSAVLKDHLRFPAADRGQGGLPGRRYHKADYNHSDWALAPETGAKPLWLKCGELRALTIRLRVDVGFPPSVERHSRRSRRCRSTAR
jgi:hypothetical protein